MILLIDGDTFAFRAAIAAEKVVEDLGSDEVRRIADLGEARGLFDIELKNLMEGAEALTGERVDDVKIALTGSTNFRKTVLETYKSKRGTKPMALKAVREHVVNEYAAKIVEGIEADDVIGIWATHPKMLPGSKLVISVDKDLRQIPCRLWNGKPECPVESISEEQADLWHLTQTLVGDAVDCYAGCPGVGPKKAEKLLAADPSWAAVVAAYAKAGLTEADALVQARVARILRAGEYDFKTKTPVLWSPAQ